MGMEHFYWNGCGVTRVPIKSSQGSFNSFPMRFLWMKEVSQQDVKLR